MSRSASESAQAWNVLKNQPWLAHWATAKKSARPSDHAAGELECVAEALGENEAGEDRSAAEERRHLAGEGEGEEQGREEGAEARFAGAIAEGGGGEGEAPDVERGGEQVAADRADGPLAGDGREDEDGAGGGDRCLDAEFPQELKRPADEADAGADGDEVTRRKRLHAELHQAGVDGRVEREVAGAAVAVDAVERAVEFAVGDVVGEGAEDAGGGVELAVGLEDGEDARRGDEHHQERGGPEEAESGSGRRAGGILGRQPVVDEYGGRRHASLPARTGAPSPHHRREAVATL